MQSPECNSAPSLSEECIALVDRVREAEQGPLIDESLIALMDEEPLKPSAIEAPECVE